MPKPQLFFLSMLVICSRMLLVSCQAFTLGETQVGTSAVVFLADRIKGVQYLAGANGSVNKMFLYISAAGADAKGEVAIYANAGPDLPGSLLAASNEQSLHVGWNQFSFATNVSIQAGEIYWLGLQIQSATTIETRIFYDSNSNIRQSAAFPYGPFPPNFPPPSNSQNHRFSFYAASDDLTPTPTSLPSGPTPTPFATPLPGKLIIDLSLNQNSIRFSQGNLLAVFYQGEGLRRLSVYNAMGEVVRHWELQGFAGQGKVSWDGKDQKNKQVAAGMYFFTLVDPVSQTRKKVIVLR